MVDINDTHRFNIRFGKFLESKFLGDYGIIPQQTTDPGKGTRFKLGNRYIRAYFLLESGPQLWVRVETDVSLNQQQLEQILREKISETKLDKTSRYITSRRVYCNETHAYMVARIKKTRKLSDRDERLLNDEIWSYLVLPVIKYFRENVSFNNK